MNNDDKPAQGKSSGTWISVANRLPDPDDDVLVYAEGTYTAAYHSTHWFRLGHRGEIIRRVSHWMPLPEAPSDCR